VIYDYFDTRFIGTLTLVGDKKGLRHIDFETDSTPVHPRPEWIQDPHHFKTVKQQLAAYFKGRLRKFDLVLAPKGTLFQQKVWNALKEIPYGQLATYQEIARRIGNPKAVRAVGGANGKNPIPIVVPCHRVIGSDGSLTGFGGGLEIKRRLIELEASKRR